MKADKRQTKEIFTVNVQRCGCDKESNGHHMLH